MKYFFLAFKNWNSINGRANLKEFWYYTLFYFIFSVVFYLIDDIYINDISKSALDKLKYSINNTDGLSFVVDDLTNPTDLLNLKMVDLWHDRAVLHFFLDQIQQDNYFNLLKSKVKDGGYVIFSEFAIGGAKKCCGLDILNYNEEMLLDRLGNDFALIESFNYLYIHPSNGNTRKYIYTLFKREM